MTTADIRLDAATAGEEPDPMVWVTVELAAQITGRHPEAIRRWIRDGVLPARRAGAGAKAAWLIRWVDLQVIAGRQRRPGAGKRRAR